MNTVMIEDLPVIEELDSEQMADVRGGTAVEINPLLAIYIVADHIMRDVF